jgi:hypothetical protein
MTSLRIGYFTIPLNPEQGTMNWGMLEKRPAAHESENVRHLRFEQPLAVLIDGRTGHGMILPG